MNRLSKCAWNLYQVSMFETYEEKSKLQKYELRKLVLARNKEEAKTVFIMETARQSRISDGMIKQRTCHSELSGISDLFDFVVRHEYRQPISQTVSLQSIIRLN